MRRLPLVLSLLASLALPALAQSGAAHSGHAMPGAQRQAAPLTDGLVKKVDRAAGEVVIQHGPLDSIAMPPMTMAFGVADKAWLATLKAGDKIRFAAEMKGDTPIVSRYELAR
ncbi:MAG: copper-binding protein [Rhodocyclaceae bacterium]|jgi:Cu/Ag efflux protein CusF|nr:copper-binding protein [Rhodocyclaceae bacterium]